MIRKHGKQMLLVACVSAAALAIETPSAQAFWGWHSSGGSSGGSWGSSGGSWGSSGSSGSWGSSGGWRWRRARHVHYYHSSGGSYGSWGSSGGSSGGSHGSWGSSGGSSGGSHGSWGSSGGSSGGSHGGQVAPQGGEQAPAQEAAPSPSAYLPADDAVALMIEVPAEAKVFINGRPTTSTGSIRRYVSRGLQAGYTYAYEIRAELNVDGQLKTDSKTVKLQAGQTADLAFAFDAAAAENLVLAEPQGKATTTLILNVPAEAKVFLAGQETKSTGEVREFSTDKLSGDGQWARYPVRVEMERDGQKLTREQVVDLKAGESKQLTFDFDSPQVAAAR